MLAWKYKQATDQKNMRSHLHKLPQGHNLDQLHKVADLEPAFLTRVSKYSVVVVNQCVFHHKTCNMFFSIKWTVAGNDLYNQGIQWTPYPA